MLREPLLHPRRSDAVDRGEAIAAHFSLHGLRALERFLGVVFEDPDAELAADFGLADALDDFDAGVAEDLRAGTVHLRIGIAHAGDDEGDSARGNGSGARRS